MTRIVELELMRPREIIEERTRLPLVFLPLGPLEWHGPHLPLGTDGLVAHSIAVSVARRIGGVVVPPFFAGTDTIRPAGRGPQSLGALGFENHVRIVGMDFPGNPVKSLYFEEGTFAVMVREIIRLLKANDYRLVVLVSGHGAPNQVRTLQRVADEESDPPHARVILGRTALPPELRAIDPGHAERLETSLMMVLWGTRVDLTTLPGQGVPMDYREFGVVNGRAFEGEPTTDFTVPPVSDPRIASIDLGRQVFEARVNSLMDVVMASMSEVRLPPDLPPEN